MLSMFPVELPSLVMFLTALRLGSTGLEWPVETSIWDKWYVTINPRDRFGSCGRELWSGVVVGRTVRASCSVVKSSGVHANILDERQASHNGSSWRNARLRFGTPMSEISHIEITHHQLPLEPAFPASWDTKPRTKFPATIVRVFDDTGNVGIGSGDAMYGFGDYQHYFLGHDPLDLERHNAVLSNIEFHAGRPWPMDIALWDLAGKIQNEPVWKLVGGKSNRIRAYASSGVHRSVPEMVKLAKHVLERGFPALKVRFGRPTLEHDMAVIQAIRG
jgi:hypothetical protein